MREPEILSAELCRSGVLLTSREDMSVVQSINSVKIHVTRI